MVTLKRYCPETRGTGEKRIAERKDKDATGGSNDTRRNERKSFPRKGLEEDM